MHSDQTKRIMLINSHSKVKKFIFQNAFDSFNLTFRYQRSVNRRIARSRIISLLRQSPIALHFPTEFDTSDCEFFSKHEILNYRFTFSDLFIPMHAMVNAEYVIIDNSRLKSPVTRLITGKFLASGIR